MWDQISSVDVLGAVPIITFQSYSGQQPNINARNRLVNKDLHIESVISTTKLRYLACEFTPSTRWEIDAYSSNEHIVIDVGNVPVVGKMCTGILYQGIAIPDPHRERKSGVSGLLDEPWFAIVCR
jgi:hypothetical protein